ncbi:histidine kinase [Bradyrhizobium sp. UNPF46]|uniref:sensor histidine kinase n=1 Tax=Bradyrhizobium sp. UNPF46 TaxID=1141168 RepID=UPI001154F66D|nr:histidine kinase [Bradyrhizobium sp. UNPF46]
MAGMRYFNRFDATAGQNSWPLAILGLGLLTALGTLVRMAHFQNFPRAFLISVVVDPLTLPMVLALRPVFPRRHVESGFQVLRTLVLNTLLCIGAAFLLTCWVRLVTSVTGWHVPNWGALQSWAVPWVYYSIVFAGWRFAQFWSAAELAVHGEKQRAAAAEAEALKAELRHLRHQLDPHFLFNALNGIAVEIPDHPDAAVGMVRELAAYLRYSLDQRDRTVTPLASVLDAARSYLELQKARFGPELDYRLESSEAARRRIVPSFLLQPLVENAVKHGLQAGRAHVDVAIEAVADETRLRISVTGPGELRPDWQSAGDPGVGLSVLNRRLQLHYPGRHEFSLRQTGDMVTAGLLLRGEPCSV